VRAEQSLPLSEVAAKSELARLLPTEASRQTVPFAVFGVGHVFIKATRDKNVRRQRIVFPPHFLDGCVHFAHSIAECREGILQAIWRICSYEHNPAPKVKQSSAGPPKHSKLPPRGNGSRTLNVWDR
jgi:hypothetical protein